MAAFKGEKFDSTFMTPKEICIEATKMALEKARRDGIKLKTLVGVAEDNGESDGMVYRLLKIKGDKAIITDDKTEKEVPFSKLFEIKDVRNFALSMGLLQNSSNEPLN